MSRSQAQVRATKLLEGVTLHTFRHAHASILIAHGVDILAASRRLGQEDVKIALDPYAHLLPGQDEKAPAVALFAAELAR